MLLRQIPVQLSLKFNPHLHKTLNNGRYLAFIFLIIYLYHIISNIKYFYFGSIITQYFCLAKSAVERLNVLWQPKRNTCVSLPPLNSFVNIENDTIFLEKKPCQ